MEDEVMKEYYEMKQKCKEIEKIFSDDLDAILEENGMNKTMAWLRFGDDGLIIVWESKIIESKLINLLQEQFGAMVSIQCNNVGNGLILQFAKEL